MLVVIGLSYLSHQILYADYFSGQLGYKSISSAGTPNSYLIIGTSTTTNSYLSLSFLVLPTVDTNVANYLGMSMGTQLSGNVISMGSSPMVYASFQYGLTTSYGSSTPEQAVSSISTYNTILLPYGLDTIYHYRAVLRVGVYYVYGNDVVITPSAAPVSYSFMKVVFPIVVALIGIIGFIYIAFANRKNIVSQLTIWVFICVIVYYFGTFFLGVILNLY